MINNPVVHDAYMAAEALKSIGDAFTDKEFRDLARKAAKPLIKAAKDNVPSQSDINRRSKKYRPNVGALKDSIGVIPGLRYQGPYIYVGPRLRGRIRKGKPWHANIIEYGSKYVDAYRFMTKAYDSHYAMVDGMIKTSLIGEYKKAIGRAQYRARRDSMSWRFENGKWLKGGR